MRQAHPKEIRAEAEAEWSGRGHRSECAPATEPSPHFAGTHSTLCAVCNTEESTEGDALLKCCFCAAVAHSSCKMEGSMLLRGEWCCGKCGAAPELGTITAVPVDGVADLPVAQLPVDGNGKVVEPLPYSIVSAHHSWRTGTSSSSSSRPPA